MKRLFFILILAGILMGSCQKEEMPDSFEFGVENSFQIKNEYKSADSQLIFSITNIDDSRCPSDVTCVWEGKADITIAVESPQPGTIILSSNCQTNCFSSFTVTFC